MKLPSLLEIRNTLSDYVRELPHIALRGLANVVPLGGIMQYVCDIKKGRALGCDPGYPIYGELFYAMGLFALLAAPTNPSIIGLTSFALMWKIPSSISGIYDFYKERQQSASGGSPPLAQQRGLETVTETAAVELQAPRTAIA